jgi:hypothetical protein
MAPTLKPQRPTPITERAPRARNDSHTHDWKDIKNKPVGGAITLGGKSVQITTVAGNQGADTNTVVGNAAFPGAQIGDLFIIAFPNIAAWTAAERTNTWIVYCDAVDHIQLVVQNNTGGNKAWPAATFTIWKA